MANGISLYECPECGSEMLADSPDEYCLDCHHNNRV